MLLFLRVGAVFQKRRPEHGDAERRQWLTRADRRHLLAHDLGLLAVEAPAPYSFGQCGTVQPLSRMRSNQTRCASEENLALRPPQKVSPSDVMGLRISGGQFCSSQARVFLPNFS